MASPASIFKHPIHPMFVVFPIGLWIFSFISDLIFYFGGGVAVWREVAYWTMAGGVIGALIAAVPGYIDFRSLSGGPKRIATWHMGINLGLVVLFAVNLWLRAGGAAIAPLPLVLSLIGVVGLGISGWLGGHLVYVHGVAVEPKVETRFEVFTRQEEAERESERGETRRL